MAEAATVEFKFYENVKKGRGIKEIPRKIRLTQRSGVAFLKFCWDGGVHFGVDLDDAKKKLSKAEQIEAFGATVKMLQTPIEPEPVVTPTVTEMPAPATGG